MAAGTVKWFDRAVGHGYVVPDAGGQDIYLHRLSIFGDLRLTLAAGDRLEFETRGDGIGTEAVNAGAPAPSDEPPVEDDEVDGWENEGGALHDEAAAARTE
jgi:CspA family cold shock protein